MQAPDAIEALASDLEARHQRELLEQAAAVVQPRVKPHTWEAWKRTSMERVPAAEVAEQLGIAIGDVYVARSRINKMLTIEVQKLQQADD